MCFSATKNSGVLRHPSFFGFMWVFSRVLLALRTRLDLHSGKMTGESNTDSVSIRYWRGIACSQAWAFTPTWVCAEGHSLRKSLDSDVYFLEQTIALHPTSS
jgi:hypothetical protein